MSRLLRSAIPIFGILCLVQSTPIKVSRPQAVTVANLTQSEIQTLIQENPTRPSILRPSEQFLPPSVPLYLPDPERNKSTDDYFIMSAYDDETSKSASDEKPTKLKLPLDIYIQPPPAGLEDDTLARQVEQAEDDKQSYSYNNRYDYYFPVRVMYDDDGQEYNAKELQLMEMQPPNESNEPNYYATKPKKLPKKYQPAEKKGKPLADNDEGLVPIDNDGLVMTDQHEHEQDAYVTTQPVEHFAPAPSFRQLTDDDLNTGEYIPKYKQPAAESTVPSVFGSRPTIRAVSSEQKQSGESLSSETSLHNRIGLRAQNYDDERVGVRANANEIVDYDDLDNVQYDEDDENNASDNDNYSKRVEFQIHGFNGPNSYKFGYDTGHGKERLFRVEEREEDGSVRGQYGFVDAKGKLHMARYSASKTEGFKAEQLPVQ